ncbi:MAG: nucleotidyltransferase family protein, partial [Lachnospiraceae bacterium]
MKITGIITEFNPFHNGHEYILSQARKQTGCDLVVVAMSGDFVQRGAPAIVDKAVRTKAALLGGADLVVELPVIASTASASDFALGGVAALAACGVDTLVFGCEQEDFDLFPVLAEFLENEPSDYKDVLSGFLKEGYSYPLARAKALERFFPGVDNLGELLVAPNNILALEYLRAIKRLDVPMKVCPIKRIAVGHHSKEGVGEFASATAIREGLL